MFIHWPKLAGSFGIALFLISSSPLTQAQTERWIPGITQPVMDSTLGAPTDGVISKRHYDEGDSVKMGDIIVELRTDLEKWEMERRKIAMETAERDLQRLTQLAEKTDSVSPQTLEEADATFRIAKAEHMLSRARLENQQIIAPFNGTIADFLEHEVGEGTKVGNPLVRLVDTSKVLLVCNVPSEYSANLRKGQTVNVRLDDGGGALEMTGALTFISPVVDAASGLLKVKVELSNQNSAIRPGIAGSIQIK